MTATNSATATLSMVKRDPISEAAVLQAITEAVVEAPKYVLVRAARALGWRGDAGLQERAHFQVWLSEYGQVRGDATPVLEAIAGARGGAAKVPAAEAAENLRVALAALMGQPKVDLDALRDEVREMIAAALSDREPQRIYVTPAAEWTVPAGQHVHAAFDEVLSLAVLRLNVLLVGPAGCGKTAMGAQVAQALDLPFAALSCTAGMSESQLAGWLLPMGEGGKFIYVPSSFVKLYENGGVFLLDELDAADENVIVFLNSALANGFLHLPQRHENPVVKRHADFVLLAAANTFGHGADRIYAGRNKLDGATLDRFRSAMVPMDYDRKLEAILVPDSDLRAWGEAVRAAIAQHRLSRVMSTRFLIDASRRLAALHEVAKVRATYFADWTRDEIAKLPASVRAD